MMSYLFHLAVCHTVVIEESTSDEGEKLLSYNASSPDELALVNAAWYFGFCFSGRDDDNFVYVKYTDITKPNYNPVIFKFQILNILEFSSAWKWMTVIVRTPEWKIKVLIKGADSIIIDWLKEKDSPLVTKTKQYLNEFAETGLRTLLLAEKEISVEEY